MMEEKMESTIHGGGGGGAVLDKNSRILRQPSQILRANCFQKGHVEFMTELLNPKRIARRAASDELKQQPCSKPSNSLG